MNASIAHTNVNSVSSIVCILPALVAVTRTVQWAEEQRLKTCFWSSSSILLPVSQGLIVFTIHLKVADFGPRSVLFRRSYDHMAVCNSVHLTHIYTVVLHLSIVAEFSIKKLRRHRFRISRLRRHRFRIASESLDWEDIVCHRIEEVVTINPSL